MGQEYEEGRRAYWAGVKHTSSPYAPRDMRGAHWLMGYIDEARAYMRLMNRALAHKELA